MYFSLTSIHSFPSVGEPFEVLFKRPLPKPPLLRLKFIISLSGVFHLVSYIHPVSTSLWNPPTQRRRSLRNASRKSHSWRGKAAITGRPRAQQMLPAERAGRTKTWLEINYLFEDGFFFVLLLLYVLFVFYVYTN